ncbi:MAG: D-alanyl-D-alanine carboxypeptidase [Hungatella sp.]|jgi:D-alanyl-D-alanine carboxypeptidase (penicillin-binding protein 5/6)|nr:D-alanyl-D-alanine carboxypeptidase [Hungatella sp.]
MGNKRKILASLLVLLLVYQTPVHAVVAGSSIGPQSSGARTEGSDGVRNLAEPDIKAEGAVVINAENGQILYGKNERNQFYPASITKLMTALLVLERCGLNDTVTFSQTATTNLESGAVTLNLTEGDRLTVSQCLYALLLKSANEVANGLAEHVSGSVAGFADLMNQKAAALGCTGTHFANPSGLNDNNHYTTPYDMALIARAAFQNQTLCAINTTLSYELPATKKSEARTITMGHKMMYGTDSRYYEGIIGGKTGYTSKAGNTLVTGVEKNGVRLIAVVMKSSSTHYEDTRALLDYGFARMGVSQAETPGQIVGPGQDAALNQTMVPGQTLSTGWLKDAMGWYYIKSDGSRAAGEWLELKDTDYWIDSNGYMATGWRCYTNGSWYYFNSSGAMVKNYWVLDNGKWFYLGDQGFMLRNTRTPDGYWVDSEGAWIP